MQRREQRRRDAVRGANIDIKGLAETLGCHGLYAATSTFGSLAAADATG